MKINKSFLSAGTQVIRILGIFTLVGMCLLFFTKAAIFSEQNSENEIKLKSSLIWSTDAQGDYQLETVGQGVFELMQAVPTQGNIQTIIANWEFTGVVKVAVSADDGKTYAQVINGIPATAGFGQGNKLKWKAEIKEDSQLLALKIDYVDDSGIKGAFGEPLLSGFKYRKLLNIENNTQEDLYNYQVKIKIAANAGSYEYDLDCAGNIEADFQDVRFTAADGVTPLPYYLEEIRENNGESLAVFWVKIPQLPKSGATCYVYYGNDQAQDFSDAEKVFDFYDGFEGSVLDLNKWKPQANINGSVSLENSVLKLNAANIISTNYELKNGIIEYKAYTDADSGSEIRAIIRGDDEDVTNNQLAYSSVYAGAEHAISVGSIVKANVSKPIVAGNTYNFKIAVQNGNITFERYSKDEKELEATVELKEAQELNEGCVGLEVGGNGDNDKIAYFDYIRVRKYASAEPTVKSQSAQEAVEPEEFQNVILSAKANIALAAGSKEGNYIIKTISTKYAVSEITPTITTTSGTSDGVTIDVSADGGKTWSQGFTSGTTYKAADDFKPGKELKIKANLSSSSRSQDVAIQEIQLDYAMGPIVSSSNIHVSGASGENGSFIRGDSVIIAWDNSVRGDNNQDIIAVDCNLSGIGGLSSIKMLDDGNLKKSGDKKKRDDIYAVKYDLPDDVDKVGSIYVTVKNSFGMTTRDGHILNVNTTGQVSEVSNETEETETKKGQKESEKSESEATDELIIDESAETQLAPEPSYAGFGFGGKLNVIVYNAQTNPEDFYLTNKAGEYVPYIFNKISDDKYEVLLKSKKGVQKYVFTPEGVSLWEDEGSGFVEKVKNSNFYIQDQKFLFMWEDLPATQRQLLYKENNDGTVTVTIKTDVGELIAKIGFNGTRYYNKFTFKAAAEKGAFGTAKTRRVYWDTVLSESDAIKKDASSVKKIVKQKEKILFWEREKLVTVDVTEENFDDVIVGWEDFKSSNKDKKETKTRAERKTANAKDNKYKKPLSRVWFYEDGKKEDIEVDPIISTENNSTVITIQTSGLTTADFKLVFKEADAGISEYYKGTGAAWSANYGGVTELLSELDQDAEAQEEQTSTLTLLEASAQRVMIRNVFTLGSEATVTEWWTIYPDGTVLKKTAYLKTGAGTEVRLLDNGDTDYLAYDGARVTGYFSGITPDTGRDWNLTDIYINYQMIELIGANYPRITEYQNPLDLAAAFTAGSLETAAANDDDRDGYNESEHAYEINAGGNNLISFDFDGSTQTRYSPFFKIYEFYPEYEDVLTPLAHWKMNAGGVDSSGNSNNLKCYGNAVGDWIKQNNSNAVFGLGAAGKFDDVHVSQPSIIYHDGEYKMWYGGYDGNYWTIGYATSPDGINWTRQNNGNRVLGRGANGKFDDTHVYVPSVIYNNGQYHMWYSGHDGTYVRIGYATSPDGITWTKQNSGNAVLDRGASGTFDYNHAHMPEVIYQDEEYKMWYAGYNGTNYRIGYATSPDGITWTKQNSGNAVLDLGASGKFDDVHVYGTGIIYDDGEYKMWYAGHDGAHMQIGYATSSDGINWIRQNNGDPVLALGENGTQDDWHVYYPDVMHDSGGYKIWYGAHNQNHVRINYAIAQPEFISGKLNNSLPLSGSEGAYGDNPLLSGGTQPFSVSAWVKRTEASYSYSTTFRGIISQGYCEPFSLVWDSNTDGTGTTYSFIVNDASETPRYATYDPGSINGEWHLLTAVYDGTDTRLYYDGSLQATNSDIGALSSSIDDLYVGWAESDRYFPGEIDDVRVYDYILSQGEISKIYNSGNGTENARENSLIFAHYKLDETSGTTLDNAQGTAAMDAIASEEITDTDLSTTTASRGTAIEINENGEHFYVTTADINDYFSQGTIEFWYRPSYDFAAEQTETKYLFGTAVANTANSIWARVFDSGVDATLEFGINDGTNSAYVRVRENDHTLWSADSWVHLRFVWDENSADVCKIYYNGQLLVNQFSTNADLTMTTVGDKLYFGDCQAAGTNNAQGIFDELYIYPQSINNYGAFFVDRANNYSTPHANISFYDGMDSTIDEADIATSSIRSESGTSADYSGADSFGINFDALGDYQSFATASNIDSNTGSLGMWIKSSSDVNPAAVEYVFYAGADFNIFYDTNGYLNFKIGSATTLQQLTDTYDNKWHWLRVFWDYTNDSYALYLDGKIKTSSAAANSAPILDANFYLGNNSSTNANFNGMIDEVYISSSISTAQIQTISGIAVKYPQFNIDSITKNISSEYLCTNFFQASDYMLHYLSDITSDSDIDIASDIGVPDSYVISTHASQVAGTGWEETVTAYDANGMVVLGDTTTTITPVASGAHPVTFYSDDSYTTPVTEYTLDADGTISVYAYTEESTYVDGTFTITVTDANSATGVTGDITVVAEVIDSMTLTSIPNPAQAGHHYSVTVETFDEFGNRATGYTGTVEFSNNDGSGHADVSIPGDVNHQYTFTSGDEGIHTFTEDVTFVETGIGFYLKVEDVSDPINLFAQQADIQVNYGGIYSFAVSGVTTPNTAGGSSDILVTPQDKYGNTPTGVTATVDYAGTITFSSSDAQAVLPANYTFINGDPVTFTGGVTLRTDDPAAWVKVEDTSGNNVDGDPIEGQQENIEINNSTIADNFLVTGFDSSVVAGDATQSVTVIVRDQFNNPIPEYTGTVSLTVSPAILLVDYPETVFPSYAFTGGESSHVFTGADALILTKVGTYTLTATDGTISNNQSGTIAVTPDSATYLVMDNVTDPLRAGIAGSLRVRAYDAYNNLDTNYTGIVTISSDDPTTGEDAADIVLPSGALTAGAYTWNTLKLVATTENRGGTLTRITADAGGLISDSYDVTVNNGAADYFVLSDVGGADNTLMAGVAENVTVTVYDKYDETPPTSYTGTATLSCAADPAATMLSQAFSSGQSSITITNGTTLETIGDTGSILRTVTVSASGIIPDTQDVTVIHAPANYLTVSGVTDPIISGVTSDVTVEVFDEFGNRATRYTGTIEFTSDDTNATLPETGNNNQYTFLGEGVDDGLKTFTDSVVMGTVGEMSVTATDTVTSSITGTQSAITIGASDTFDHLGISSISQDADASGWIERVTAYDPFSNILTTDSSTVVTMTSNGFAEFYTDDSFSTLAPNAQYTITNGIVDVYVKDNTVENVVLTATCDKDTVDSSSITVHDVVSSLGSQTSGSLYWKNGQVWRNDDLGDYSFAAGGAMSGTALNSSKQVAYSAAPGTYTSDAMTAAGTVTEIALRWVSTGTVTMEVSADGTNWVSISNGAVLTGGFGTGSSVQWRATLDSGAALSKVTLKYLDNARDFYALSERGNFSTTKLNDKGDLVLTEKTEYLIGGNNYDYRRAITITNTGVELTNYPMQIDLDSSNFSFANAQANGEDVRFTTSDEVTEIDYWIENWDQAGETARVWVEVPTIAATADTIIYIYYGNSSVSTTGNGFNTFAILFDDFNSGTIPDGSRWVTSGVGDHSVGSGVLTLDEAQEYVRSNDIYPYARTFHMRAKTETAGAEQQFGLASISGVSSGASLTEGTSMYVALYWLKDNAGTDSYFTETRVDAGTVQEILQGDSDTAYHTYKLKYLHSSIPTDFYYDDVLVESPSIFPNQQMYLYFYQKTLGTTNIDWAFITPALATDPTYSIAREFTSNIYNPSGTYTSLSIPATIDMNTLNMNLTAKNAMYKGEYAVEDSDFKTISNSMGYHHAGAIYKEGQVRTWGKNDYLQLGSGTIDTTSQPSGVTMKDMTNAVKVVSGAYHTLVLLDDGTIKAWGLDSSGQLGDGPGDSSTTTDAVTVSGITNAVDIAAGGLSSYAVLSDGTIRSWGCNADGQLGDNSTTMAFTPVTVLNISTAVHISAGGQHAVALLADGTLRSWGNNRGCAALGNTGAVTRNLSIIPQGVTDRTYSNSPASSSVPVTVQNTSSIIKVAAGYKHNAALLSNGTVRTWGLNQDRQLGTGATCDYTGTAATVTGITNAVDVACGGFHTVILLADGTIRTFGRNNHGQLGQGNTTTTTAIQTVSGISNVKAVGAGLNTSYALTNDGKLYSWGENTYGEIGDGTQTTPVTSPARAQDSCYDQIALYHFNNAATDASGNGLDLTLNGGAVYATGRFNNCLQLNGTDQYAEAAANYAFSSPNSITLEAWINPTAVSGTQCILYKQTDYRLSLVGANLVGEVYDGSGWQTITSSTSISAGVWTHVAFVFDKKSPLTYINQAFLYINGAIDANKVIYTGNVAYNDQALIIGANYTTGYTEFFNGLIDEVRISGVARGYIKANITADGSNWIDDIDMNTNYTPGDGRSIQYAFELSSATRTTSPTIEDVTINYGGDPVATAGNITIYYKISDLATYQEYDLNNEWTIVPGQYIKVEWDNSASGDGTINNTAIDECYWYVPTLSTEVAMSPVGGGMWEGEHKFELTDEVEGSYEAWIRPVNTYGTCEYEDNIEIDFDAYDPQVTVEIDNSAYTTTNWVEANTIKGTATDGVSLNTVEIRISNGTNYWTGSAWGAESWVIATGTDNWTYDLAAANLTNDSTYTVTARATDNAGNITTIAHYASDTFLYDTTAPTATVTIADDYHNDSSWVAATTINGTAVDSGSGVLSNVQITISNGTNYWTGSAWGAQTWLTATGTGTWTYNLPLVNLTDDTTYTITARATDTADNTTASGNYTTDSFFYDTTEPTATVTIADPYYNDSTWVEASSISGTASDSGNGVLSSVEITISNGTNYWTGSAWGAQTWLTATGTDTWTYTLAMADLTDGMQYTVTARAVDAANNTTASGDYTTDSFYYDTSEPTATVTIAEDYYNATSWVDATTINGTASDNVGLASVQITIDNGSNYWTGSAWGAPTWLDVTGTDTWTYNLPIANLTDGVAYRVVARAVDTSGNITESINYSIDNFTYDNTASTVSVTIAQGYYDSSDWVEATTINGTAYDVIGLSSVEITIKREQGATDYYWDGTDWDSTTPVWLTATGTDTWTYSLASSALTDQRSYLITARATDTSANTTAPADYATDEFTYTPILVISSTVADPIIAGVTGSITVRVQDGFGNAVSGYTGEIEFTSSDTQATLPEAASSNLYTFLTTDNGVKTFTDAVIFRTAAEQTLTVTATDPNYSYLTDTQTEITVNPAAEDHLQFEGSINTPQLAGTPFDLPRLMVMDEFENHIATASGQKTVAYAFVLPALADSPNSDYTDSWTTTVDFTAGYSTTTLTTNLYRAQTAAIIANADDLDGTDIESSSFVVNPEIKTQLAFTTQPSSTGVINAALTTQPVVAIQDAFGNQTADTDDISLYDSTSDTVYLDATGDISADVNPLAAVNGAATFSNARFSLPGTVYFYAEVAGINPAFSESITLATAGTTTVDAAADPTLDFDLDPTNDDFTTRFKAISFAITDDGSDATATLIDRMQVAIGGTGANASTDIAWAALYTGITQITTATGSDITDTHITFGSTADSDSVADLYSLADGTTTQFTVYIYMNTDALTAVDTDTYTFDIDESNISADGGLSSGMASDSAAVTPVTATIDVNISHIEILTEAAASTTSLIAGTGANIQLRGVDANKNIDVDYFGNKTFIFSGLDDDQTLVYRPRIDTTNFGNNKTIAFVAGESAVVTLTAFEKVPAATPADVSVSQVGQSYQCFPLVADVSAADGNSMVLTSGNTQTGAVNAQLANPYVVTVSDIYGNPATGTNVDFAISSYPGGAFGQALSAIFGSSDDNGEVSTTFTFGNAAGDYQVSFTSAGITGSPVTFTSTAVNPGSLNIVSGSPQIDKQVTQDTDPLVVNLLTVTSLPVANETINFSIISIPTNATGQSLSSATAVTDGSGEASVILTVGDKRGDYVVRATYGALFQDFTITAQPGNPYLVELSGPTSLSAGEISTTYTISVKDNQDNLSEVDTDTVLNLTCLPSTTGVFSTDALGNDVVTSVTIPADSSSTTFYYIDTVVDTITMNAAWASGQSGLFTNSDSLTVDIVPGDISYFSVSGTASLMDVGNSQALTIQAYDPEDNLKTDYSGSINITFTGLSVSPSPSLEAPTCVDEDSDTIAFGTACSLEFTAGAATTTLTVYRAESGSIKANAGSITTPDDQDLDINVLHLAADHLKFTAPLPSPVIAGTQFDYETTLEVVDIYDNICDNANGATPYNQTRTIAWALSGDSNGPDSGTDSFTNPVTFAQGVSTTSLNATLYRAQQTTITPSIVTLTGTNIESNTITVNADAVSRLRFSQEPSPTCITSQAIAQQPIIAVSDQYGNAVTASSSNITLSASTTTGTYTQATNGTLGGGLLTQATSEGVATFSGITYSYPETIYLQAVVSGYPLTPIYSSPIAFSVADEATIADGSALTEPTSLSSLVITPSEKLDVMDFTITDAGADGYATQIQQIVINRDTGTDTTGGWTNYIQGAYLNYGGVELLSIIEDDKLTFGSGSSTICSVANGGNTTLTLSLFFQNTLPEGADGKVLAFSMDADTDMSLVTVGSQFSSTTALTTAPEIAVVATAFKVEGTATMNAGDTNALTITAIDANGNTDMDYTGDRALVFSGANTLSEGNIPTCTNFASSPVNFGASTTTSFALGVNTSTSNMVLYTAETATIKVTDGTHETSDDDALEVVVSGGVASQLAWGTEPEDHIVANAPWKPFTVNVTDAYGNVASSNTTVTLSIRDGSLAASGDDSAVALYGVATFYSFAVTCSSYQNAAVYLTASATGVNSTSEIGPIHVDRAYTVTINATDYTSATHLSDVTLEINDESGITLQGYPMIANSPFTDLSIEYGSYTIVLSKEKYMEESAAKVAGYMADGADGTYDNVITWDIIVTSLAEATADYNVKTGFVYDEASDKMTMRMWLERRGKLIVGDDVNKLGVGTVEVYDDTSETWLTPITFTAPETEGIYFRQLANVTAGGGDITLVAGNTYFARCTLGYGGEDGTGRSYYTGVTFEITISESLKEVTEGIASLAETIVQQTESIKQVVEEEIETAIDQTIVPKITEVKTDTSKILAATGETSLPDQITSVQTSIDTEVKPYVQSGILTRESTVKSGDTLPISYRTASGLSPSISMYNPTGSLVINNAAMRESGASGVYYYNVTFNPNWGKGDYMIVCSESTQGTVDALNMTVVAQDIEDLSGQVSAIMGNTAGIGDLKDVADSMGTQFGLLETVIGNISTEMSTATETGMADTSAKLDTVYSQLVNLSGQIQGYGETGKYDELEGAFAIAEDRKEDIVYLKNKTQELKAVMDISRKLLDNVANQPQTQVWYEFR